MLQRLHPSDQSTSPQITSHAVLSDRTIAVYCGNAKKKTESRKESVGTFGIAEDHMVCGDLKLYWLRFQYNKWQCGFSFIKQYFQIQLLLTLCVLPICWLLYVGYGNKIYYDLYFQYM